MVKHEKKHTKYLIMSEQMKKLISMILLSLTACQPIDTTFEDTI